MATKKNGTSETREASRYLAPAADGGLRWGPLVEGTLLRRYKRFLADVELVNGETVTAHTANTGTMLGCSEPGRPVWLSHHDVPTRKLKYTLEMIAMPTAVVGVNTGVPNKLVRTSVLAGRVPELPLPEVARPEVTRGDSRLDLLLSDPGRPDTLVEIKNCSLVEDGTALFPDAVTARGAKHLGELADIAAGGERAVLFIVVQRGDAFRFSPADRIDPEWGRVLRRAMEAGVELLVYRAAVDLDGIRLDRRLPVVL